MKNYLWQKMPSLSLTTFLVALCRPYEYYQVAAFSVPSSSSSGIIAVKESAISNVAKVRLGQRQRLAIPSLFFAVPLEESSESNEDAETLAQLPPTSTTETKSLPPPSSPNMQKDKDDLVNSIDAQPASTPTSTVGTTALFINQQTKRVLIEELGYRRAEVERLRPELALSIMSKRLARPQEGVPAEWLLREDETPSAMLEKLEKEQQYPLKFPLLAVSLILVGKGLSDALITAIKVYIDFPGSDLLVKETFMGLPVLGIDLVCVIVGIALGSWTWNAMKD